MSGAAGALENRGGRDLENMDLLYQNCFTPLFRALRGKPTSVCLKTSKSPLARKKNIKLPLKSQEEETKAAQTN